MLHKHRAQKDVLEPDRQDTLERSLTPAADRTGKRLRQNFVLPTRITFCLFLSSEGETSLVFHPQLVVYGPHSALR